MGKVSVLFMSMYVYISIQKLKTVISDGDRRGKEKKGKQREGQSREGREGNEGEENPRASEGQIMSY